MLDLSICPVSSAPDAPLMRSGRFEVRHRIVPPGAALDLRGHFHRSEHWVAVSGAGEVRVDGVTRALHENASAFVPAGTAYAIENTGKVDLHLIEIRTGAYLGDDDVFNPAGPVAFAAE